MEREKNKVLGKTTLSVEKCSLEMLDLQRSTTSYIVEIEHQ